MVSVHPRVSGYLGRALSLELSAVQQYMTQACLADQVDLIEHYAEAVRFCEAIADTGNRDFFAALWQEESHHGQELQEWLATLSSAAALAEPQHATF